MITVKKIVRCLIVFVIYNFKNIQCKVKNLNIKLSIIVQTVYQKKIQNKFEIKILMYFIWYIIYFFKKY